MTFLQPESTEKFSYKRNDCPSCDGKKTEEAKRCLGCYEAFMLATKPAWRPDPSRNLKIVLQFNGGKRKSDLARQYGVTSTRITQIISAHKKRKAKTLLKN